MKNKSLFNCKIYKYFFIIILLICAIVLIGKMYYSTYTIIEGATVYSNDIDKLERNSENEKRKKNAESRKSDSKAKESSNTEQEYQRA